MVSWGKTKENAIGLLPKRKFGRHRKIKLLWRKPHDALFIRIGRFYIRLMKPWR